MTVRIPYAFDTVSTRFSRPPDLGPVERSVRSHPSPSASRFIPFRTSFNHATLTHKQCLLCSNMLLASFTPTPQRKLCLRIPSFCRVLPNPCQSPTELQLNPPRSCLARPTVRQRSASYQPPAVVRGTDDSPCQLQAKLRKTCSPPRIRSPSNPPPPAPSAFCSAASLVSSSLPSTSSLTHYAQQPPAPSTERKPLLRRLSTAASTASSVSSSGSNMSPSTPIAQDVTEPLLACCIDCFRATEAVLESPSLTDTDAWEHIPFSPSAKEKRRKDAEEAMSKARIFGGVGVNPSSARLPSSATGVVEEENEEEENTDEAVLSKEDSPLGRKVRSLLVDEVSMARRASQTSMMQFKEEMERDLTAAPNGNPSVDAPHHGTTILNDVTSSSASVEPITVPTFMSSSPFQSHHVRQPPRLTPPRRQAPFQHPNTPTPLPSPPCSPPKSQPLTMTMPSPSLELNYCLGSPLTPPMLDPNGGDVDRQLDLTPHAASKMLASAPSLSRSISTPERGDAEASLAGGMGSVSSGTKHWGNSTRKQLKGMFSFGKGTFGAVGQASAGSGRF